MNSTDARIPAATAIAAQPEASGATAALRAELAALASVREPLHVKLRNAIVALIAADKWSAGDKLPAERDLCEQLGISLGTVQKSLAALALEGVLVRRHGHGTFVAGSDSRSSSILHFRFAGDDGRSIAPVYAEAIERRIVDDPEPWRGFLVNSRSAIQITRRINVAGNFDCISDFFVDADRFAAILSLPFAELHRTIIRKFIAKEFNTPTLRLSQQLCCGAFSARIAELLRLRASNAVGITLEVRAWTHGDEPLFLQEISIPPGARPLLLPPPSFSPK